MTPTSRISLATRRALPQTGFVCPQCRLRASTTARATNPSVTLPCASRRHSSWLSTDQLRKKIWGSETPPGPEDPYAKESLFDRSKSEREQEEEKPVEPERIIGRKVEVPKDQTKYVPASTTEGLATIGWPGWGTREWEDQENNLFQGFMEPERKESRNEIVLAIHRALVETYALKEAELPLVMDYYSEDPTEDYAELVAGGAHFEQEVNGETTLVLQNEELRQSILKSVTPRDVSSESREMEDTETEEKEEPVVEIIEEEMESREAEERPSQGDDEANSEPEDAKLPIPAEEAFDPVRSSDRAALMPASDTWRNVSLEDPAIKFAVLKRVMQLTGRRIPDPDIAGISTPQSLLVHLVRPPKPKKVAEALAKLNQVTELANVQILDRRYGPVDREMEVGRWKVITEELTKRGLPMTRIRGARQTK